MENFNEELAAAMRGNGITPPEQFIWDDTTHRYPTNGKPTDDAGYYNITIVPGRDGEPDVAIGWYGDHRVNGDKAHTWRCGQGKTRDITKELRRQAGKRSQERQKLAGEAAEKANAAWEKAKKGGMNPDEHPYSIKKNMKLHPAVAQRHIEKRRNKETGELYEVDCLIIAMRNRKGHIRCLQSIDPEGGKKFTYGATTKGLYCAIGGVPLPDRRIWVAEGVATANAVNILTGQTVIVAFSAAGLREIAVLFAEEKYKSHQYGIAGDPGSPGEEYANRAAAAVGGMVSIPLAEWELSDWDDVLRSQGLDAATTMFDSRIEEYDEGKPITAGAGQASATSSPAPEGEPPLSTQGAESDDWEDLLIMSAGSRSTPPRPMPNEKNCILFLANHPDFKGMLAFDQFTQLPSVVRLPNWLARYYTEKDLPIAIDNNVVIHIASQLQSLHVNVSPKLIDPLLDLASRETMTNSLTKEIKSLKWDGIERLDTWLVDYGGAADNLYVRSVTRKWMISAIARALRPGTKVDHALILEGEQGLGKSKLAVALAGKKEYFTDDHVNFQNRDGAISLIGKWICELAELTSLKKSDVESAKAFITRSFDCYRPVHGKRNIDVDRTVVFMGTTNSSNYLSDATGNRRFWPVTIYRVDDDKLRLVRDQLWAEALAAYESGEKWWFLDDSEVQAAMAQQSERQVEDAWQAYIDGYLEETGYQVVSLNELLRGVIHKDTPISQVKSFDIDRIRKILMQLGWRSHENVRISKCPPEWGRRPRAFWHPALGKELRTKDLMLYRMNPAYQLGNEAAKIVHLNITEVPHDDVASPL